MSCRTAEPTLVHSFSCVWLSGFMAVVSLLVLTPRVRRDARGMMPPSHAFAIIMSTNGLRHFLGSVYFGEWIPGVYTTPLLLTGSTWPFRALYPVPSLLHGRQRAKHKDRPTL